jgi:hypothetical protein
LDFRWVRLFNRKSKIEKPNLKMVRLRHLVAISSLVLALGVNALAWAAQARTQTQNRAGLIVQMADGSVVTRCVAFNEESLTGYELLRRARLPMVVEVTGMGPAVCKIGDSGCNYPQQSCFCQCNTLDASCTYWAYAQIKEGAWRPSPLGAAGSKVRNGDVDGWKWGKGDGTTGENPPALTFDEICSAPAAQAAATQPAALPATAQSAATAFSPTPTPMPISTPAPPPSETPLPATAPAATNTAEPTTTPFPSPPPPAATPMLQPTFAPTATPARASDASSNNALPLLGFGAMAAALAIGYTLVRRKRDA